MIAGVTCSLPRGGLPLQAEPSPLGVLTAAMRQRLCKIYITTPVPLAQMAAPYLHPGATNRVTSSDIKTMTDEQLDELRGQDQPRVSVASDNSV
jgi:hypothetical protein